MEITVTDVGGGTKTKTTTVHPDTFIMSMNVSVRDAPVSLTIFRKDVLTKFLKK